MDTHFGGVIWTNHALERLRERGISQSDAFVAFNHPSKSNYAKTKGAWHLYRQVGSQMVEIVASQNERKEWVIMTVWSKPIYGYTSGFVNFSNFLTKIVGKILNLLFGRLKKNFSKSGEKINNRQL